MKKIQVTNPETAEVEIVIGGQARRCRLVSGAFRALANEKKLSVVGLMGQLQEDSMNIVPGVFHHALRLSGHVVERDEVDRFFDELTLPEYTQVGEAIALATTGNAQAQTAPEGGQ